MTKIKICGIKTPEAALHAAANGADLIGIIFAVSKRQVSIETAASIVSALNDWWGGAPPALPSRSAASHISRENWFDGWKEEVEKLEKGLVNPQKKKRPLVVGVFSNQEAAFINEAAAKAGLDFVQLHGNETPEFADLIERPVIRAVHVGENDTVETISAQIVPGHYSIVLLDTKVTGLGQQGGSGVAFDWTLARNLRAQLPFLIAGGLTPDNVSEAIQRTGPWGVDVSSGVETEGVKDLVKIGRFLENGRQAHFEL